MKYSSTLPSKLVTGFRTGYSRINKNKLIKRVAAVGLVLLIINGYLAYTRVYLSPERRFWMAIENNLTTSSVVRETQTGGTGNLNSEKTRFTFGAQAAQNKISSASLKSATSESNVTTQTVTTVKDQYIRYLNIFSSEKKESGDKYDFSKLENVWAMQPRTTGKAAADSQRTAYIQPLVTLVPFGNLTASSRDKIMDSLKKVYVTDFKHVTYQDINDEKFIVYSVQVQTKKYVMALKQHFIASGLGEFAPLDPSAYPENAHVNAQFIINKKNNNLTAISFNNQSEHYTDYGITNQITIPTNTITLDELQQRLQAAQ